MDSTSQSAFTFMGMPKTAGKSCAPASFKAAVSAYQTAVPGNTYTSGTSSFTAYCAHSRILQSAVLLSAATLVASSQLIWSRKRDKLQVWNAINITKNSLNWIQIYRLN